MDRLINSKTTTIKIPTVLSSIERPLAAILKHDALVAVLVSANPLRTDYSLDDTDFEHIAEAREKILGDLRDLEDYLYSRIKRDK